MTATNATDCKQAAAEKASGLKGLDGILRAGGVKTALVADERAERPLIGPYAENAQSSG